LQELGLAPWRHIVVLAPERRIANRAYLDCWRKHLTVVTDPSLIDRLEPLVTACGFRFSTLFPFAGREPLYTSDIGSALEEQWNLSGRAPLLALTEEQDEAGRRALAAHGIKREDWFVCLHVRETGFHGRSDHTPRNAAISGYFQAVETITRQGGWVIRMGDPSMSRLPAMERVIDYAHSDLKSPAMDVFLCAKCRCYVGTNSGLGHVPYTFGTPTVMTNWITAGGLPCFPRNGIYLPKLIYSAAGQRLLSFRELLAPEWRARSYTAENLADNDAHFVDNTPDEIEEIVLEMLERIDGRRQPLATENNLQEKFAAFVPGVSSHGATRVGSAFLHRHLALL
jgi:putative glycosyltransferase (TIGR04372 family)